MEGSKNDVPCHGGETFYGQKNMFEISENTKMFQIKKLGLDFDYFSSFRCAY